jgi:SAM-dependent methyltransferase
MPSPLDPQPSTVFGSAYSSAYDALYRDKDYQSECDLIERVFREYGTRPVHTILDLGCGTGNHAIPLAQRGYEVVGVDRSADMLEIAREKAEQIVQGPESRVESQERIVQGPVSRVESQEQKDQSAGYSVESTPSPLDPQHSTASHPQPSASASPRPSTLCSRPSFVFSDLRSLNLKRQFDAVLMMFAVLGYQYTDDDVITALKTVRQHLAPGGIFICDFWYGPAVLAQGTSVRTKQYPANGQMWTRRSSGTLDRDRRICEVEFEIWNDSATSPQRFEETHKMRYFFPDELQNFFASAGLTITRMGSFPNIDTVPSDETWNVLTIATTKTQASQAL